MTSILQSPATSDPVRTGALRRPGIAFLIAGAAWVGGDVIEMAGYASGPHPPGPMLLLGQLVFVIAEVSYAFALITGARRGLAGRSTLGRTGLFAAAVCFLFIMVATTLAMLGLPQLTAALPVVGPLRNVAEVLAGVGVLLAGPQRMPGRAVFLVYAIALFVPMVADHVLPTSGEGPGFINEVGQALLWIVIGASLLRAAPDRRGRVWFALAVVIGAIVVVGIAVPH